MLMETQFAPAGYEAAHAGAALHNESQAGRMFMRGRDRAALLHRLSTNQIERLKPGGGLRTVLTTPIGRIIDLVQVYALDDALLLLTGPGQGRQVFGHLRKNIFFNDQVTVEAAGRSHSQIAVVGPQAGALLRQLAPSLPDLALHQIVALDLAGATVLVARSLPIGGDAYTLVAPDEHAATLETALIGAGAVTLSDDAYNVLRVEQGYGAVGNELSQAYIPLETGLDDAISFTKGCYVGQEIIARMESRGRLAKQLRGLRLSAPLQPIAAGEPLSLDAAGKEAGDVTSAVVSPRFGPIALAYVRSAHAEPGTTLGIAGSDVQATVVALPFE